MAIASPRSAISTGSATSVSFATLPTAGSTVIVHVTQYRSLALPTQPTVADNQGVANTYTLVTNGTATITTGNDNVRVSTFVCKSIGATSGTFTITETGTDGDRTLVCEEYTGTDTTNTVNISGNATAAGGSTAISKALTSTVTNCYGTAAMTTTTGSNPFSMTPANETTTTVKEEENNATAQCISVANDPVATAASHTGGFTHASAPSAMTYTILAPATGAVTLRMLATLGVGT